MGKTKQSFVREKGEVGMVREKRQRDLRFQFRLFNYSNLSASSFGDNSHLSKEATNVAIKDAGEFRDW